MEYDSIILYEQNERINELNAELLEWTGYEKMELIYRGTRDGMTSNKFHEKCDNQGPTITLIKTDKNIFGGYTSISWSSDGNYHTSPDCFIFTLISSQSKIPANFL